MSLDLWKLDATALAEAVRAKQLSAAEATEAALRRIEALDPLLGAFCERTPDLARAEAVAVDRAIAAGDSVGPFAGVPYGVKDLICTKGVRTTSGSVAYADFVPDEDDVVVERMRAAGAAILGKTTAPEFGYSGASHNPLGQVARNPWNTALTPGGSSSGSGAAVAAGLCALALGSDGGGSVRIPAAHCGLFGMKASMGRVPLYPCSRDERYPGVSSWETLEHIGPITRSVRDAALMLSVIAGPDARDRLSIPCADIDWLDAATPRALSGLRVAYSADLGYAPVDPEVRRVAGEAALVFERDLGCIVEAADPGFAYPGAAFWPLMMADSDLTGMRAMAARLGRQMSSHLAEFVNYPWTAADLTDAKVTRKAVVNALSRFMRRYDLLLTPTLAVPPFALYIQGPEMIDGRMVGRFDWTPFTYPFNFSGQPAASIPAGFTKDGLPVGLQIVGRHLDDAGVLRAAAAFEVARPWAHLWPAIATA